MKKTLSPFLVIALSLVLCACSKNEDSAPESEQLACQGFGIRNGTRVGVDELEVVGAVVRSNGGLCSGTLVTETTVLTAAHCLVSSEGETAEASEVTFVQGQFSFFGTVHQVTEVRIHPDYSPENGGVGSPGDLAVLKLAEPIEVQAFPQVASSLLEFEAGEAIEIVGFGQDNIGSEEEPRIAAGLKQKGTLNFSNLVNSNAEQDDAFLGLVRDQELDQNACPGDSGGPALIVRNGITLLVGVAHAINSSGSNACLRATASFYTSTASFIDWIDENAELTTETVQELATQENLSQEPSQELHQCPVVIR